MRRHRRVRQGLADGGCCKRFSHPRPPIPIRRLPSIRRLVVEYGLAQWHRYAMAFLLMGVAAACTAIPVYLLGDMVNTANIQHDFSTVVVLGVGAALIFALKGAATYGQSVILSRIANHIIAENQRRLFSKLLNESIGFFANRHSSEFAARLMTGASAATQVLNLLINSVGRDLLSLIALVGVMVYRDPLLALMSLVVFPPAMLVLRKMIKRIRGIAKTQFTGGIRVLETLQETLQGIRVVKAFSLEDVLRERFDANVAAVEREANKMARVANRTSPLMEILGGFAMAGVVIYGGHRVIDDPRIRRCVRVVHHRLPAGGRAGEAARPLQHGSQQQSGRRSTFCSRSSTAPRPSRSTTIGRSSCSTRRASSSPGSSSPTGQAIR